MYLELVSWMKPAVRELIVRELGAERVITGIKRISRSWVVTWESRKYVETGDIRYLEAGPWKTYLVSDSGVVVGAQGTNLLPHATRERQSLVDTVEVFEQVAYLSLIHI